MSDSEFGVVMSMSQTRQDPCFPGAPRPVGQVRECVKW